MNTYDVLVVFDDGTEKKIRNANAFNVKSESKVAVIEINQKNNVIVNWDIISINKQGDKAVYQTTSLNEMRGKYIAFDDNQPKYEALSLFGVQSNFSLDEQKTYMSVLSKNAQNANINIFDLF